MGMDLYNSSFVVKDVWDCVDNYFLDIYGKCYFCIFVLLCGMLLIGCRFCYF